MLDQSFYQKADEIIAFYDKKHITYMAEKQDNRSENRQHSAGKGKRSKR